MKKKTYEVYVPIREFWVVSIEANSKKEAIQLVKSGDDRGNQKYSIPWNESPNGRFEYQAITKEPG